MVTSWEKHFGHLRSAEVKKEKDNRVETKSIHHKWRDAWLFVLGVISLIKESMETNGFKL